MDFPKKQAQRLMPLYLLEYSEKLFENHPNPEAPWGGGGSDYTAGYGIDITNSEISVDTEVIATKSDIASMVTTSMLEDALDDYALKTDLPENVSDLNNDAGYTTQTWVENQGYLTSSALSDYVTSSELTSQLSNYALSSTVTGIASQVTTLESLVSNHTTQINSINSNITDLQTLTSTHTSQISGINSSITSLESLVNTNISNISTIQNNLSSLGSQVTTLEGLVSTNTSNISTIQSAISDMSNHPFYRGVDDGGQYMYFDWDGTDPFYKTYLLSNPAYVRLNALNPNYSNGLIASYNSNTLALDVSLDENAIPHIDPNYPQEPVQTLSTLRVNGVVYGIPSGATYSAGTGISINSGIISIDNTVALKSELFSGDYNDLSNKPTIPTYSLTTTSTPVLSSATLSQSYETLTFTYSDNTTASFNFLTTGTSLSTSTVNVLDSASLTSN